MVAVANSGQFLGAKGFKMMPGKYYRPPHLVQVNTPSTMNTTGARYYTVPFIIEQPTALAGAWCYNGGAADSGDKFKMALFSEAAAGGPGTMVKSFGEGTFTGAAALNSLTSSFSAAPGRYYLEFVTDNAVTMLCMSAMVRLSDAGYVTPSTAMNTMGAFTITAGSTEAASQAVGDYVGGTYGNFPEATSLTLTTSLFGASAFPLFGLTT